MWGRVIEGWGGLELSTRRSRKRRIWSSVAVLRYLPREAASGGCICRLRLRVVFCAGIFGVIIVGMSDPIVIAYHLVWTLYGWWLPNDPRGSTSRFIRSEVIFDLGNLHYGRKRIQPASSDLRAFYEHAGRRLKCELLELTPRDALIVAESFAATVAQERYTCYACAIMPDHIHLLIRKHKHDAETMIANFQSTSRVRLRSVGLRDEEHPVWGGPGWKVFLDHPEEIRRTIKYIEDNPVKMRQPCQKHPFVIPYDGWPLHPGHSPNSPYAKRLRDAGRY